MTNLTALTSANDKRWKSAKPTRDCRSVAARLAGAPAKARYQSAENRTGVPWFIVAVIHEREASQKWDTQLGQGDPLNRVSVHRPTGRGPFKTWEDGAYDALVNCAPFASRWKDWSAGGAMTLLEQYNGLGYAGMGIPSPYVWSGTDQYKIGKYVADGKFDPNVVDQQLGCAGLLLAMMAIDPTITFTGVKIISPTFPVPPKPQPAPASEPTAPLANPASGLASFISAILSIFRRK